MSIYNNIFDFKEYHFVKFEINSETIKCISYSTNELKNELDNYSNQLIFPIPYTYRKSSFGGKISCNKIISISMGNNYLIMLRDKDKNILTYNGLDPFNGPIKGFEDKWIELLKLLERHLFPYLVNNIVEEILKHKEFEINKPNGIKMTMDGIYLGTKFIDIENVICQINFKNWEIKISNKKNFFQNKKISTSYENIIIIPYLIDCLKIIHNQ